MIHSFKKFKRNYEKQLATSIYSLKAEEITRFLEQYSGAEEMFDKNNLKTKGIQHEYLLDFLINIGDTNLFRKSETWFEDQHEPFKALNILEAMRKKEVPFQTTRLSQENIARMMIIGCSKEEKEQMMAFVNNDKKWYRALKKAYLNLNK